MHSTLRLAVALFLTLEKKCTPVAAYSIGDVDPRALRGVWRLTSLDKDGLPFERRRKKIFSTSTEPTDPKTIWKLRGYLPMKEFTTYPKKILPVEDIEASNTPGQKTEIFIKLKDDHTFEQCASLSFSDGDAMEDESLAVEDKLAMEVSRREKSSFAWKGTWDFVDGKLILAADRPEKKPFSQIGNGYDGMEEERDTILVGRVSVQQHESLRDNPIMEEREMKSDSLLSKIARQEDSCSNEASDGSSQTMRPGKSIDVHLSVPKGTIKTGKFMYPKDHPSFFEQPIVRPQRMGSFELRQILGEFNTKLAEEDEEVVELFRKRDLVGKRFYLSTFPIPKHKKKGRDFWSSKEQKWVHFETPDEKKLRESQPGKNMQVMAVELFANNTFSTIYGLGDSTTLRGKWSIIGEKRDQLWMMVYRFGFGRSVSGSTYSEGIGLTQNDEKGYWGKITEVESPNHDNIERDHTHLGGKKIEINGAIMVGWGLEPCSVGRFKMIEIEEDVLADDGEGDIDEEEDEKEDVRIDIKNTASLDALLGNGNPGAHDGSDSYDLPGSFE